MTTTPANAFDGQIAAQVTTGDYGFVDHSIDFGFVPVPIIPATLGNLVWLDEDGNGLQDVGEPGLAGVGIQLYNGPTLIATVTTDPNGGYTFTGVEPGTYTIQVDASTLPDGIIQTTNPTNTGGDLGNQTQPYSVTVTYGEENLTADFGYNWGDVTGTTNIGAIGDKVWLDTNADGIQDEGEIGISGVSLSIYSDSNGDLSLIHI